MTSRIEIPEPNAFAEAMNAWNNGEDGARDRLNAIIASWVTQHLPVALPSRYDIGNVVAMTITAGIVPYLQAEALRIALAAHRITDYTVVYTEVPELGGGT